MMLYTAMTQKLGGNWVDPRDKEDTRDVITLSGRYFVNSKHTSDCKFPENIDPYGYLSQEGRKFKCKPAEQIRYLRRIYKNVDGKL